MVAHLTFIKELKSMPSSGPSVVGMPVGQIADIATAVGLDVTIGGAAVQIPAGTVAIGMHETTGTAFRYAVGESDVAVPDAPNAHRWTSYMGRLTIGVTALKYIKTAAA